MSDNVARIFAWRGRALITIGDITEAVGKVASREEAAEFMAAYRAVNPQAESTVGYVAGYHDEATMVRIWEWFDVSHPFFGRTVPTPEEAFRLGMEHGEALKRSREVGR